MLKSVAIINDKRYRYFVASYLSIEQHHW